MKSDKNTTKKIDSTQYECVYKTLLAIQILEIYKPLLFLLNNKKPFLENPAAQLAFALSGLHPHFELNHDDSIGNISEIFVSNYQRAMASNSPLDFFEKSFKKTNSCFGGISKTAIEYSAPSLEEIADLEKKNTPLTKLYEYYRAFRTIQIRKLIESQGLDRSIVEEALAKENPKANIQIFRGGKEL